LKLAERWTAAASLAVLVACGAPGSGEENRPGADAGPPQRAAVGGVTYSAETRIAETAPVTVYATARVENTSSTQQEVTFPDGCVVLLRAYRDASRTGAPAWDQQQGAVCTMMLVQVSLAPGESREFVASVRADEILGDSLPAGRYYFTAVLRPDGQRVEIAAGKAELAK
jgi:hypothetical protein